VGQLDIALDAEIAADLLGYVENDARGLVQVNAQNGGNPVFQIVGGQLRALSQGSLGRRQLVEVVALEHEPRVAHFLGGADAIRVPAPVEQDGSVQFGYAHLGCGRRRRHLEEVVVGILDELVGELELGNAAQTVAADPAQEGDHHLLSIPQGHLEGPGVEHNASVSCRKRVPVVPSQGPGGIPVEGK
jgi:hypothetical protein